MDNQTQRELKFSRLKPKTKTKLKHFPKDLDAFIRENEQSTLNIKQYHLVKVNLSVWERIKVLFGANPTLSLSFDLQKNKVENLGTIV